MKLAIGDLIRVDTSTARYKVTAVRPTEVDAYGGKRGRLSTMTFPMDKVIKCRSPKDNSAPLRAAIYEVSVASKRRKPGRRR